MNELHFPVFLYKKQGKEQSPKVARGQSVLHQQPNTVPGAIWTQQVLPQYVALDQEVLRLIIVTKIE